MGMYQCHRGTMKVSMKRPIERAHESKVWRHRPSHPGGGRDGRPPDGNSAGRGGHPAELVPMGALVLTRVPVVEPLVGLPA
jgi:hypothetical protein